MFFIILIILSVSLLFQLFKIKEYSKHDHYLYMFCDLRREVMQYLRMNHDIISQIEYKSIKQLLRLLNNTINLYADHKTTIFNFRKFVKYVNNTKNLTDSSKRIIKTDNDIIAAFHSKLNNNIVKAFFAYTPFLFSEICFRIFSLLVSVLIKMGIYQLNSFSSKLSKASKNLTSIYSNKELITN